MRLYAESSAVIAWLLDEATAGPVERALTEADIVIASELTVVETERVLGRLEALGELAPAEAAVGRGRLHRAAEFWVIWRFRRPVLERAGRPFPLEPVRTLDALHLASAIDARDAVPGLAVLSLDERIRVISMALGFEVMPRPSAAQPGNSGTAATKPSSSSLQ